MIKMMLEFDKQKIIKDNEVSLKDIENAIMEDLRSRGIYKDEKGFYVGGSFANFGNFIFSLMDIGWMIPYIKEWKWYNSDRCHSENEFIVEDILSYAKNGRSWEGVKNGIYLEKLCCQESN